MNFPAHEEKLLARRESMMERQSELTERLEEDDDEKACDAELAAYWLYVQREWIGGGADDPDSFPHMKMIRAQAGGFFGESLEEHLSFLRQRTRHVRFFTGDWKRAVASDTQTKNIGTTGVFLDPPYIDTTEIYSGRLDNSKRNNRIPLEARAWALEHGESPDYRIAYCGYEEQHEGEFPGNWVKRTWKKANGYSTPAEDEPPRIDTVWFSPHCLKLPGDPQ